MNSRHGICVAVVWLLLVKVANSAGPVPYPEPPVAAAFSLPDVRDVQHNLEDYRGKVVLVNFWASWCPPCVYEMPSLVRLQEHFAGRPFEILAINAGESRYKVRKFVRLINFELPVLLDSQRETFTAWKATILPTSYLLDTEGRIRYRVQGDLVWDSDEIVSLVESLLPQQQ